MLNGLPKTKKNLGNDVRILDSIIITTESLANTLFLPKKKKTII